MIRLLNSEMVCGSEQSSFHNFTHNTLRTMTTSFITDQVDHELSLDDMKSVNGGLIGLPIAAVGIVVATVIKDIAQGDKLGTGLGEVIDDLVEAGGGNSDVDVVKKGS